METVRSRTRRAPDNRGSAVITVVIAMVFVVTLGAAILFIAYTGYQAALTERGNKTNFYRCSAAMDDIRAGLEDTVTEDLASAYTNAVKDYARAGSGFDPQSAFANEFAGQLTASTVGVGASQAKLFASDSSSGSAVISGYSTASLAAFLSGYAGSVTLGCGGDFTLSQGAVSEEYDSAGVLTSVTLKSLSVKYADKGYESEITSDIAIKIPEFFAKSPLSESLNNCAVIADKGITQNSGGSVSVSGGLYSGGLTVTGNGNSLTLSGGNVICLGTASASDSASLIFNAPKYELWANEITAGNGISTGSVNLNGKVYVANDLVLSGDGGSSATLSGTYFGFGNDGSNPDRSSAILINGRNSKLDISSLSKLSLAGVSFVDLTDQNLTTGGGSAYSGSVPMGQSLAVKSDQLAYLVPPECLSNYASNPCLFTGSVSAPDIHTDTVIWGTKKLSDYIGNGKGDIRTLYKNLDASGNKIAYVLLVFSSQKYANAYFQDYFAEYPDQIAQYLGLYARISDKSSDAYFNTAGSAYYTDGYGTSSSRLALIPASDTVWTDGVQARYGGMSSPLSEFANVEALSKLPADTELDFVKNGEVVAVVTNKPNFDYDTHSDSLQLIVSTGNVAINADYSGLVLTESSVSLSADISAAGISSIAASTCGRYTLSDFLTGGSLSDSNGSGYSTDSWAPGKLVTYVNWATD